MQLRIISIRPKTPAGALALGACVLVAGAALLAIGAALLLTLGVVAVAAGAGVVVYRSIRGDRRSGQLPGARQPLGRALDPRLEIRAPRESPPSRRELPPGER